jgi:hypothetical protein
MIAMDAHFLPDFDHDLFWEGDTTTTRANQKTNIPKSTGFAEKP